MKARHSIIFDNGGVIYLPPNPSFMNLGMPDLAAWDTEQQYDLSTKFRFNGKTFVHARSVIVSGTDHINSVLIASKGAAAASPIEITYCTTTHDAAVGATQIVIEKSGVTADEYKYGHVILGHQGTTAEQNRGILGNTASNSDNEVTLDLDIPLWAAVVDGTTGMELWLSPYSAVEWAGVDYEYTSILGIPMVSKPAPLAGQYLWLQTWGPCWVCPGDASLGATASERMAVFDGQGQLRDAYAELETNNHARQVAGYLLEKTKDTLTSVSAYDGEFIMLMLDP